MHGEREREKENMPGGGHAMLGVGKSKDNFVEFILSYLCGFWRWNSGCQACVATPLPMSHLGGQNPLEDEMNDYADDLGVVYINCWLCWFTPDSC